MEWAVPSDNDGLFTTEKETALFNTKKKRARFRLRQWFSSSESFLSANSFIVIFLTLYILVSALMFLWGAREEYLHTKTPVMRWFISIARGFGYVLNLNCGLVILLASRLALTALRDTPLNLFVPFDKSFPKFHIVIGYVIVSSVCGHGVFHLIWIINWKNWATGLWGVNMCVGTGAALVVVMLLMVASSIQSVRKLHFEIFYFTHNLGAMLFFTLLLLHGVYRGVPYTYKWITGPIAVYAIDRSVRRMKTVNAVIHLSKMNSTLKGANVLRLKLPKQFEYHAGQYAEVKVKSVNRFEWHPFTIASAPHENDMCFYIKALGDWTNKVRDAFQSRISNGAMHPLQVHIRGPFGAPAQHVRGYQRVVLISGGVGSTPFCSICKDLYWRITRAHSLTSSYDIDYFRSENSLKDVLRAEEELMSCVTQIYENNVRACDEDEDEECNDTASYSLNELFVVTNECSNVREMTPPSVQSMFKSNELNWSRGSDTYDVEKGMRNTETSTTITTRPSFLSRSYSSGKGRSDTTSSSEGLSMSRASWIDGIDGAGIIQNVVHVSRRQRALSFLHTIGVNISMYMAMLARIFILALASIFDAVDTLDNPHSSRVFSKVWMNVVDLFLGTFILFIVTWTLCLELFTYRWAFFEMRGRTLDLCILLPLIVLSLLCSVHFLADRDYYLFLPAQIHVFVVFPLLMFHLVYRLYRIIGSRVLLADSFAKSDFADIRALDFVWTVPYGNDDDWLREELAPLANGAQLCLHRFVTREKCPETKDGKDSERGMKTTFGRPDWEQLFQKIGARTPSNAKVGVFFCGPKGMSRAIKETIMKVQVLSNLRGKYLGTSGDEVLARELRLNGDPQLQKLRSRGSNIRFVFREENFG